jgi:arginase family enzyme
MDWFTSAHSGARMGPRAIRESSNHVAGIYAWKPDYGLLDVHSGEVTEWVTPSPLVDTGDVPLLPTDVTAQIEVASAHVRDCSLTSDTTVVLGGDHFVAFPSFQGVFEAWRERHPNVRFGYLHIDSHPDFFDSMSFLGRFNHGTCARRISEIPNIEKMAWFGLNRGGTLEPNQFAIMHERGFRACTSMNARRIGIEESLEQVLDYVTSGVDVCYVSIDIDVINGADAQGTHSPAFEGFSAEEFLAVAEQISAVDNLVGLDLCEVAPPLDTSHRTQRLAAVALLRIFGPRLVRSVETVPPDEFRSVFLTVPTPEPHEK